MKKTLSILFLICLLSSCTETLDSDIASKKNEERTLIFGHRATGSNVKSGFLENTIPAAKEALQYADGIEIDIQLSSSNTLWMYHNSYFTQLNTESQKLVDSLNFYCLLNAPDSIIENLEIDFDGLEERIYPLEDLFLLLNEKRFKDKLLSLDVKGYFDSECISGNNVSKEYFKNLSDELYHLIQKYDLKNRVIIETDYTYLFELLKAKDKDIQCFILGYSDLGNRIEKSLKQNLEGISFNIHDSTLNAENTAIAAEKNLKLQLWTINNENDLEKSLAFKPYAIQISDIKIIKSISENKKRLQH